MALDPMEDDDPTLTGDMLELYWETTRTGMFDVFVSTRTAVGTPWSPPVLVTGISTSTTEASPEISGDGLTMMFTRYLSTAVLQDIVVSTRATREAAWEDAVPLAELNSPMNDYAAVIAGSGLEIFFHSERAGGMGGRDLYTSVRPNLASPWGPPVPIVEFNSPGEDESPFLLPGDLQVLFGSSVSGNRDIYLSSRAGPGQPWGPPVPLAGINTPADESDPWLSPDGHTLFFSTSRSGNSEIYQASR